MLIRHPQQTVFQVGPKHWLAARASRNGLWDVVEITERASRIHHRQWKRHEAEVLAAAYAATRRHNSAEAGR